MAEVLYSLTFEGSQEAPTPRSTEAFGTGLATFDTTTNTLSYVWQISGIDFGPFLGQTPATPGTLDDATGFHFHSAPRGQAAGIVFDIPAQDTDDLQIVNTGGNTWMITGSWEPTDPANSSINNFAAALAAGTVGNDVTLYGNVHTTQFPSGEIRGQLVGFRRPPDRDFNGDGKSDVLWLNTNGTVHIWEMNGPSINSAADETVLAADVHIRGTGDFTADGRSDLLLQNDAGTVFVDQADDSHEIGAADASWAIRGTGDFNGDSNGDILWQNTNGTVHVWLMNGSAIAGTGDLGVADATWHLAGTGDFGGDGRTDVLWQNDNGAVAVWQLSGTSVLTSGIAGFADPTWHIRGTGDFGGDGNADILWQNDNGAVAIWEMSGATVIASGIAGFADATWHIRGTGDYGGDGMSDILWQNDSGAVAIWEMDGTTVTASTIVGAADPSWSIVPPDGGGSGAAAVADAGAAGFGFGDLSANPPLAAATAAEFAGSSADGGGGGFSLPVDTEVYLLWQGGV